MSSQTYGSLVQYDSNYELDRKHNSELGWLEVSKGLRLILLGHVIWIVTIVLAVWMLIAGVSLGQKLAKANAKVNWGEIIMFVTLIVIGLIGLYCYFMVLVGQWRCLHAPERAGAKWFIFVCMTCIILAPMLDFASGFLGGGDNVRHLQKGLDGMEKIKFMTTAGFMQLLGGLLGFVSFLCFLFFLRATAYCFEDWGRVMNVNLCITFNVLLTGAMVYLAFRIEHLLAKPEVIRRLLKGQVDAMFELYLLLGVGAGLIISGLWYLWLIASTRSCIETGMRSLPKPLQ
jgi:hypothetical protein